MPLNLWCTATVTPDLELPFQLQSTNTAPGNSRLSLHKRLVTHWDCIPLVNHLSTITADCRVTQFQYKIDTVHNAFISQYPREICTKLVLWKRELCPSELSLFNSQLSFNSAFTCPCSHTQQLMHTLYIITEQYLIHTYIHPFNGLCPGLPGSAGTRKVKPISILLKQETVSGSGICKSASRSRQITTPALVFLQAGCPSCRPTNSVKAMSNI